MQLISAIPGEVAIPVKAPRPIQMADQETVLPARSVRLQCGQPIELPDDEARVVLLARGKAGIVEIPRGSTAEDVPMCMHRAREQRYRHLRALLDNYRIEQGMRQASGRELLPPSEGLRRALVESKKLKTEMVESDPVAKELMGDLPQGTELEQAAQQRATAERTAEGMPAAPSQASLDADAVVSELSEFGISPKAAPLMPGVTAWDQTLPDL